MPARPVTPLADGLVSSSEVVFAWRKTLPRYAVVLLYAVAMAFVESAAVLYLRTIYGGVDPVGIRNTPFLVLPDFNGIEIGREFATLVMLATVGYLAGRGLAGRGGAFLGAFGLWDICYYLFLWLFAGWPTSFLAPDILFLIPLPWWGPVLSPVLLATFMVIWGALALARESGDGIPAPSRRLVAIALVGVALCLTAFMFDALQGLGGGLGAAFSVRAGVFPWPLFLLGLITLAAGATAIIVRPHAGGQLAVERSSLPVQGTAR